MSSVQYLINTLAACEKNEFDNIVKIYIREVLGESRVILTDGPYDAGIDIKVFTLNNKQLQYQLTTQSRNTLKEERSFDIKVYSDLEKAKINFENFGYDNSLYFFCSHKLTNTKQRSLQLKAKTEYNINLTIFDANSIAEEAEIFLQLYQAIVSTNDLKAALEGRKVFPSEEKHLLYDLLSFGKTSDFKMQIIEAYILTQLYAQDIMSLDKIVAVCQDNFKDTENRPFYQKLLNRLMAEKKVAKSTSNAYTLSDNEKMQITHLNAINQEAEKDFIDKINSVLKRFNQADLVQDYIRILKDIFVANFNSDIAEIMSKPTQTPGNLSREFTEFIKNNGVDSSDIKSIASALLLVCKENQFIQKYCAAKVFSDKTNINIVERYVHTQKRIFIDTQIALYLLCYYYSPHSSYANYFFNAARSFIEFVQSNNIVLNIPDRYVWEVQNHLREGLNLIPFTSLSNFEALGQSKNVFYNFYLHEYTASETRQTLKDFFGKFGFRVEENYKTHNQTIEFHLNKLGIEVVDTPNDYEIEKSQKIITNILRTDGKFKSKFGLHNDAILMEYFSDDDVNIHPLQPLLISWDKVLFKSQREYFSLYKTRARWFLLTPERFVDQYSLLKFSVNSDMITKEILAYLTSELIQTTHILLDSIAQILNPNDPVGLEYTMILADIRDNEVHRIKENRISLPDEVEGGAVIDDVMYNLMHHYRDEQNNFEDFRRVFTAPDLKETVTSLIKESIDAFYANKTFDHSIFAKFDRLIETKNKSYISLNK